MRGDGRTTAGALALGAAIVGALCVPGIDQLRGTDDGPRPLRPVCVQLVPGVNNDPDSGRFETWQPSGGVDYRGGRWVDKSTGQTLGYSAEEDSAIYNRPNC